MLGRCIHAARPYRRYSQQIAEAYRLAPLGARCLSSTLLAQSNAVTHTSPITPESATRASTSQPKPMRQPNPTSVSIEVTSASGISTQPTIHPTPKAPLPKLIPELQKLLSKRWLLDERGDAIHRHIIFRNGEEREGFEEQLAEAADEMKHHPHVTCTDRGESVGVTVTCTTHRPKGLGMRDVKLAWKVDELASKVEIDGTRDKAWGENGRRVNREAIDKALAEQEGACFTDK